MTVEESVEKVKADFAEVVGVINKEMGAGYAAKNPALVQHLLSTIQQEENRKFERERLDK